MSHDKHMAPHPGARKRCPRLTLAALSVLLSASGIARAQCQFSGTGKARVITYRFQPEETSQSLVLHVTLEFQSGPEGTETLVLPTHWAGQTLHTMINLRAVSDGASLAAGPDPDMFWRKVPQMREW